MHGRPFQFLAEIGIPNASQCLMFVAPILAVAGIWWVVDRVEFIMDRLFPQMAWEKQLGWLNIRAEQQAEMILRWLNCVLYAVLAVALYGIVWGAEALPSLKHFDDPHIMPELDRRISVLLVSLGFWLVYLGYGLIPKLRRQFEMEELDKFRAEQAVIETEQALARAAHKAALQTKPRLDQMGRSKRMGR